MLAKEGFIALQVSRGIVQCKMTMSEQVKDLLRSERLPCNNPVY